MPEPDVLPPLPPVEQRLPFVPEVSLTPVHKTVSAVCGIDVSHYQGKINWQMVATDSRANYVYIKATESATIVDEYYRKNLAEAQRSGIPAGVYHFFSPSVSVMLQLKNFLENVDFRRHDLIPVIDVEKRGRGSAVDFHNKLRAFLHGVEKQCGVRPIIYTGVNFYNEHLAGRYTDYRFMIARYGEEVPTLFDDVPIIMWQFTSQGLVAGINGKVDCSCFLDNFTLTDILLPKNK